MREMNYLGIRPYTKEKTNDLYKNSNMEKPSTLMRVNPMVTRIALSIRYGMTLMFLVLCSNANAAMTFYFGSSEESVGSKQFQSNERTLAPARQRGSAPRASALTSTLNGGAKG